MTFVMSGEMKKGKKRKENCISLRLGEIWKKLSDHVLQLSIFSLCANLKNATLIQVPHPKDDMHRPFEFLLLSVFTEMWEKSQKFHFSISMMRYVENRPSTHFSIIFLSIKHNFSKIRGGDFFDLFSDKQNLQMGGACHLLGVAPKQEWHSSSQHKD